MTKIDEFREFEALVSECTLCELSETRNKVVPGAGNINADILIVGEAPGAEEDGQGIPFIGKAGQLLTKILEAVNIDRKNDVYITNIIKCRPPENRNPTKTEIENCRNYLYFQIETIEPRIIVTLGNPATHFFIDSPKGITSLRGHSFDWRGKKVFPMYHPSYLLRKEGSSEYLKVKKETWNDIRNIKEYYNSLNKG